MANLKEVRERIKSVKNTQQITKAMKMVSASKLRRAQIAITQMRPYADKLDQMLRNILSNLEGEANTTFGEERPVESVCVVVATSSKGLCGAFNTNVIKQTVKRVNEDFADVRAAGKLSFLCIGKKGYEFCKKEFKDCTIIDEYVELSDNLAFDNIVVVAKRLMAAFEDNTYDRVDVVYSKFKNAVVQIPQAVQFLPVAKLEMEEEETGTKHKADYLFEPSKEELLNYLVPSIIQNQFQKYLLDTSASEHGARMSAMDSATENAQELLNELKLTYNKARQAAITNELSEIVGGAAALENG